ncbi:MAG: ABC transporter ATP-binding protein [Paraburkholderia sp.]|jgi:putative spermidine/putrescine transport system ATP-binding protein|nr:ABC transporter ATP-binding protein [Paraburkholderia sp.]
MTASGAHIEFRGVQKRYGAMTAVEHFDAVIEPGSFVTLLGSSGSGKTTLLNMLAGFIEPTAGDILLDGRSIVSLAPEARNIGMVFQNYSLFPHMSVAQNVAFPLAMRRVPKSESERMVADALAAVQLSALGKRMPRELSGGQQQRVAVARAISFGPRVLLMDEPLGALDLKLREALQFEIKRIQRSTGSTVVYVTHDQSEAMSMSDEIIILRDGKLVQRGSPKDVYDQPANAFVATFVGQSNTAAARRDGKVLSVPDWGLEIASEAGQDGQPCAAVALRPEKIRLATPDQPVAQAEASAAAIIENVQMFGNNLMVHLRLRSGKLLLAQQFRTAASDKDELFVIGAAVHARFHPEDLHLLND